ncbi:hypothetical protein AOL_s00169g90 [Orbilia oligospora ATCC 24927]|uniref:Peptide hydrolase n=1 Tax=Arthrobotrys oligospora (strain ATCC 24927 / CBS 115.81 / DSM 1491) TaxID=756982 RepID=G1XMN7_ARTOA|nr:hypothetical protein AOL_s00169g90 [Orbilia oligospora ATCC 24927]EGX45484.1 hypothetical protein AOL_s00169g90 [Orbilia oligospora ATCC 24927]
MPTCGPCKVSFLHFRPFPVTIFTVIIYLALFIPLLIIHYVPPTPPPNASLKESIGVDLEDTWRTLAAITKKYHPYNSRANDHVRSFLVDKVNQIIEKNGNNKSEVIEDNYVNVLYTGRTTVKIYFESLNVIVKVQGSGDFEGVVGDVLVNAHYDSVSTAPGATDDGVAVVTVLGLIDYFTQPNNTPRRDMYFLLNNGEEDYLNGAMAFTEHPLAKNCRIFLNLEGAGAGGRATLFRSTDAEVTKFFKRAKYPFGSSLSGDAFKQGFIRSQTDYIIFDGELGMRGLDLAFWQPRARYHTQWDSMAFTSINSLWHMFETSLSSLVGMAHDGSYTFVQGSGRKHTGVWFDMFGRGFAIFQIADTFIWSICLLTITPFFIFGLFYLLASSDKLYLLASSPKSNGPLPPKLELAGCKGFWRPFVAILFSTSAVVGTALLIAKVNPMIMYSSQEAIWVCLISLWIVTSWFSLKIANWWRPSATARTWSIGWISFIAWLLLVLNAVAEDRLDVGGMYFTIFYYMATALALVFSLLDLFFLPPTSHIYDSIAHADPLEDDDHRSLIAPSVDHTNTLSPDDEESEPPNEQTSLLRDSSNLGRGRHIGRRPNSHGSLSIGAASSLPTIENNEDDEPSCSSTTLCASRQYPGEQYWSRYLPRYTWLLQAIILIPVPVIITAQIALIVGTSIAQTGADGNNPITAYILYAVFTILILLPLQPFLHRWTRHIPLFLFFVFVGTLLYLLLAFPFSWNNPLKVYFAQTVDLRTGENRVHLVGVNKYIKSIVEENIPSAWAPGADLVCKDDPLRLGLQRCSWPGKMPNVVPGYESKKWASVNATSLGEKDGLKRAKLEVRAKNTRACRVNFEKNIGKWIKNVDIFDPTGKGKTVKHKSEGKDFGGPVQQIRLWSREWGRGWDVVVEYEQNEDTKAGPVGVVECLWSDANDGGIKALEEIKSYLPQWAVVSKLEDGLVIGEIPFATEKVKEI